MPIPRTADPAALPALSPEETLRYSRHLLLPQVGLDGQKRLKSARVLLIGAGGLGSPAAMYLAAAGVGTLGLVDFDTVDASNLQRQLLHGERDIGRLKVDSAADRLRDLNPHVRVETHPTRLSADNALDLMAPYDLVVDGADNFPTRYLVNDTCVLLGKPNVHGSIFRFDGQATVFWAGHGPCYRCLYPEAPPPGLVPSCAEGGVLGVLPGIVGCIQASEAIKLILGVGETLVGRLLTFQALEMRFREFRIERDPDCPLCGDHPTIHALEEIADACALPADSGAVLDALSPRELAARLQGEAPPLLLDVRTPEEAAICRIDGAILIPLAELERRRGELEPARPLVVYCKSGVRSARAVALLREAGFRDVKNLAGGILAWADDVNPSLPKY